MFIAEIGMDTGDTGRLFPPFEFGTNGAALGNIADISLANGFVAGSADKDISTAVVVVSVESDTLFGDIEDFDCSSTDTVGVIGDI